MKPFCHIYAQWDQIGPRIDEEASHLLDLGLICDSTINMARAPLQQKALRRIADAGGLCAPNIYPGWLDASLTDSNWWKYPEDQCVALLAEAARRYESLDLGPLRAVNTYTPGNSFVSACRRSGIGYILGFCAPTVIEDGGWEIAHYGSPLSPYFVSSEDFRKPEPPRRADRVLISSMELRNPMVCLNHWSEGPWCPLNAQAADRWLEPTADPLPFLQIAEDWLKESELAGRPLFFHLNLQYFFAERCYEHNRRALEWLAEQRDKGRLEVGSLQDWARRLETSGGFLPQTTYWRGEMMGFHVGHRPGCFPDVIVDESLDGQVIWQHPKPLPERFYDYRQRWSYPAFQPDGNAPESTEFGDVTVRNSARKEGTKCVVDVEILNPGTPRRMPIALWDALAGYAGPFEVLEVNDGWTVKVVPHPGGSGGALIAEGEISPGTTTMSITVRAESPTTAVASRRWGTLVAAQTFWRQGRPYTYLAAQTTEAFCLEATLCGKAHAGEPVILESLCGLNHRREVLNSGRFALSFDGSRLACWHRVWGVAADEIELIGVDETEERLRRETARRVAQISGGVVTPDGPGYQLFGNIRDRSRWDREVGRLAGEKEITTANTWFAGQRPDFGETVIEAHPGAYLPRGSITKVLGHEFDSVRTAPGYEFRELCADYPQGWDWGVSAWVQWRQLRVALEGLKADAGTYHLHLHAFDPEARDICQRVHFFNPSASPAPAESPIHRAELCGSAEWLLPKGISARWSPSALYSIEIPRTCLDWPSVGVWIAPLEKKRLYDWIAEDGAPGLLSHLWLTVST